MDRWAHVLLNISCLCSPLLPQCDSYHHPYCTLLLVDIGCWLQCNGLNTLRKSVNWHHNINALIQVSRWNLRYNQCRLLNKSVFCWLMKCDFSCNEILYNLYFEYIFLNNLLYYYKYRYKVNFSMLNVSLQILTVYAYHVTLLW